MWPVLQTVPLAWHVLLVMSPSWIQYGFYEKEGDKNILAPSQNVTYSCLLGYLLSWLSLF